MKKIIVLFLFLFSFGCTPIRYVYIDQTDSVIKRQRIIYNYQYVNPPLYHGFNFYLRPYYNPFIIDRTVITPRRNYQPRPNRFKR